MFRRFVSTALLAAAVLLGVSRANAQQPTTIAYSQMPAAASCPNCAPAASMPVMSSSSGGLGSLFGFTSLFGCNSCSTSHFCCPVYTYHQEGAPKICIERNCSKPVCVPCTAPNWGYFQTCWTPWPWPQDFSHCPVMPPAAVVIPGMTQGPGAPASTDQLPTPRKTGL